MRKIFFLPSFLLCKKGTRETRLLLYTIALFCLSWITKQMSFVFFLCDVNWIWAFHIWLSIIFFFLTAILGNCTRKNWAAKWIYISNFLITTLYGLSSYQTDGGLCSIYIWANPTICYFINIEIYPTSVIYEIWVCIY